MSATATATRLPAGTWKVDLTHSSATFAVKHMAVGTFRGGFENLDAALIVSDDGAATLQGTVRADSITVKDENLRAHLGSPDFFDIDCRGDLSVIAGSLIGTRSGSMPGHYAARARYRGCRAPWGLGCRSAVRLGSSRRIREIGPAGASRARMQGTATIAASSSDR